MPHTKNTLKEEDAAKAPHYTVVYKKIPRFSTEQALYSIYMDAAQQEGGNILSLHKPTSNRG